MKNIIYISFLFITVFGFAQKSPTKTVEIVDPKNKKLHFEDVKIESKTKNQYKTLEIRYKKLSNSTQSTVIIDNEEYKCFPDKKSAVRYYFAIKKTAPNKVVYYVNNFENKKPEIITFRIE